MRETGSLVDSRRNCLGHKATTWIAACSTMASAQTDMAGMRGAWGIGMAEYMAQREL